MTGVKQSQLWGLRLSLEFDKIYVLLKVVRAKLPGTLEGGGVGVKHKQTNNFFDKGAHFYHNRPWGIGLTSISNVKRVVYTQFPIMGELHLTSVSIFHDMEGAQSSSSIKESRFLRTWTPGGPETSL